MDPSYKTTVNGRPATVRYWAETSNLNCEIIIDGGGGSFSGNFGLKGSPRDLEYRHAALLIAEKYGLQLGQMTCNSSF